MLPILKRSVEYLGLYGIVKSFNDRPEGSTLRAYREQQKMRKEERERERESATLETADNLRSLQNVALMLL